MNLDAIVNEVLEELFEGYVEHGGGSIFDVTETITKHGENPHEIGKYLVEHGWVKYHQYRPTTFVCAISMSGIQKIRPDYIDGHLSTIVSTLGVNGNGWTRIMETLGFEPKDFQRAHDLARLFDDNGIIQTQFHHDDVIIKLTLRGRELYEKGALGFH